MEITRVDYSRFSDMFYKRDNIWDFLFTAHLPENTQRRYNVAATSRRCSDAVTTLLLCCVFARQTPPEKGSTVNLFCSCVGGFICDVCSACVCSSTFLRLLHGEVLICDYGTTWVSSLVLNNI